MKRIHCHFPSLQWSTERGKKYNTNWKVYEKHDSFPVGRLRRWWLWRFLSTHVEIFSCAVRVCVWPTRERNKMTNSFEKSSESSYLVTWMQESSSFSTKAVLSHRPSLHSKTVRHTLPVASFKQKRKGLLSAMCVCVSNSLLRNR